MSKKEKKKGLPMWAIVIICISILLVAFIFTSATEEYYIEQIPYQATEQYTEWISAKNCDNDRTCTCEHEAWWGLGACDSCSCVRERVVTKLRPEQRTRYTNRVFGYEQRFYLGY